MHYRTYGKTGLKMSVLGFGAAYLPTFEDETCDVEKAAPVLQHAIDLGVNHLDTAHVYIKETSELAVGRALKGYDREKLVVSTKIPSTYENANDPALWWSKFEDSMRRLDTPYVDILYLHGLGWKEFEDHASKPGGALESARKAQAQGLVRHISFSSHDKPENVIRLLETGEFAGVLVQYSLITRDYEKVINRAGELGMGTACMGSLAVGRLAAPRTYLFEDEEGWLAVPSLELALRFLTNNPSLTVALSGMRTIQDIEANVQAVNGSSGLDDPYNARLQRYALRKWEQADQYCTICGECLPCPQEVNIPENFRYRNWKEIWSMGEEARQEYAKMGESHWGPWVGMVAGKNASACNQCGECEPRCPHGIPIIRQLAETASILAPETSEETPPETSPEA